jgi:hypothetical protein
MIGRLSIGSPIPVENFFIYPFKIKEVIELEDEYYKIISPLLISEEDLKMPELEEVSFAKLIALKSYYDKDFKRMMLKSLSRVTKTEVKFDSEYYVINNTYLTGETWNKIRETILEQNVLDEKSLKKKDGEDFNPGNEKAEEMREKFKKNREKIEKIKKKKSSEQNNYLIDAINNFCAKSPNTNLIQVQEFTLFMFWSQYSALIGTDTYDKQTQAIFAGADPKKMKAPHWAEQKIKKEE